MKNLIYFISTIRLRLETNEQFIKRIAKKFDNYAKNKVVKEK